jgi:hypothetical protein
VSLSVCSRTLITPQGSNRRASALSSASHATLPAGRVRRGAYGGG